MPDSPVLLHTAHAVVRRATVSAAPAGTVVLTYDARFLRRRRLVTEAGMPFLVDLSETVSLEHGDALALSDGRLVGIVAAEEAVLVVTGDLPRLAWHIGNRHTPCQIESDRLIIRQDHVLEAMLRGLGARVNLAQAPFTPEGGAYGHGRTMGHSHGPEAAHDGHAHGESGGHGLLHPHAHDHAHDHAHGQGQGHDHGQSALHEHSPGHDRQQADG